MGAPGRPGTQEVGSEYPFITCPCSPHRKPETVSTMHLFMGDRWGGQESSHPRKQVHARSLRGFLGSPCFLPPWKMPSMDLYLLWPFFQSTGRKKWGCWARGGVFRVSHRGLRVPTAIPGSLLQQLQGDSLMGRGYLLRDHPALLILSDAPSPPGMASKASQQREGFPQGSSNSGRTDTL